LGNWALGLLVTCHLGLGEKNLRTFKDLGSWGFGQCSGADGQLLLLVNWALKHLGNWALGLLGTWSLSLLDTWAFGNRTWGFGQCSVTDGKLLILVNWALRYLENWALGLLGTWSLVSWTLGLEDLRT
jgi:hypothetical protein